MLLDLQPSYFTKQFKYRHWIRLARMAQKITIQKAGCVVESKIGLCSYVRVRYSATTYGSVSSAGAMRPNSEVLEVEQGLPEPSETRYDVNQTPDKSELARLASGVRAELRSMQASGAKDGGDELQGDSFSHGVDTSRTITPRKAFIHLVKGNIGPGCLSMAAAASHAGGWAAAVLSIVIVGIGLIGWHMIWQCKVHTQASGARTFGDIGERAFGRAGRCAVCSRRWPALRAWPVSRLVPPGPSSDSCVVAHNACGNKSKVCLSM